MVDFIKAYREHRQHIFLDMLSELPFLCTDQLFSLCEREREISVKLRMAQFMIDFDYYKRILINENTRHMISVGFNKIHITPLKLGNTETGKKMLLGDSLGNLAIKAKRFKLENLVFSENKS